MNNYIFAASKDWNHEAFRRFRVNLPGNWIQISHPNDLNSNMLRGLRPDKIFFPHWSWVVPDDVLNEYDCICFHMTDLPYGRGGSPLQNLIKRGINSTKVSALKMTSELDAGPIYLKQPLSLDGSGLEIFENMASVIMKMILEICERNPIPVDQEGDIVTFKRREAYESELDFNDSIRSIYNHIRMLDIPDYPKAFLNIDKCQLEFFDAVLNDSGVDVRVKIRRKDDEN